MSEIHDGGEAQLHPDESCRRDDYVGRPGEFMTIGTVGKLLGLTNSGVAYRARRGPLPFTVTTDGRMLFPTDAILRIAEEEKRRGAKMLSPELSAQKRKP